MNILPVSNYVFSKSPVNKPDKSKGIWDTVREIFGFSPSPVGCGGEEPVCGPVCQQIQDGGTVLYPPDVDQDAGTVLDSGAVLIDGGVILPTDDASTGPRLPDDVFFLIEGEGSHFQETPDILLETGYMTGAGLQRLNLQVEIGTDSSQIAGMPEGGCYPGLINTTPASEEDIADGASCPEPGYESFLACPSDPNQRLPLYISRITIEAYRGEEKIGETTDDYVSTDELNDHDPEDDELDFARITEICGTTAPIAIPIPSEYYEDGSLNLKVKLNLIVDARGKDPQSSFMTYLVVRVKDNGGR